MSDAPPEAAGYRDRQLLKLVRDLIAAAGDFHEVTATGLSSATGTSAESTKLASLELAQWEEHGFPTDTATTPLERVVQFWLYVTVREDDPDVRDDEVDRLYCSAANAVNGVSVGGLTLPAMTRLRKGHWLPADGPQRTLKVLGEFAYLIDDYAFHATSPD